MKTWSETETSILVNNYNSVSNDELYKLLPGKTPLAIYKKAYSLGLKKDKKINFLNRSNARKGEKGSKWNGGISHTRKGYKLILKPEHPRADSRGYVLEHIYVFEKETGIQIPKGCCIHHINGIKDDNRISNLCMMTHSAHTTMHNLKENR